MEVSRDEKIGWFFLTSSKASISQATQQQLPNGKYCPGGALDHCINFCPRDTYAECVAECGNVC